MKELEDEALRNATVGTQTGIQDTFEKTTSKAEELDVYKRQLKKSWLNLK